MSYNFVQFSFSVHFLLDPSRDNASKGICEVAEAVTHARFVGTSTASDEVVLMKILKVLIMYTIIIIFIIHVLDET